MSGEDNKDYVLGEFPDTESWRAKTDFLVGMPLDPGDVPTMYYQALQGNVYTLQRWPNGSTARGEIPLDTLQGIVGGPVREGWYSAQGEYLGATIKLD